MRSIMVSLFAVAVPPVQRSDAAGLVAGAARAQYVSRRPRVCRARAVAESG